MMKATAVVRCLFVTIVGLGVALSADFPMGEIERLLEEERFAAHDRALIQAALAMPDTSSATRPSVLDWPVVPHQNIINVEGKALSPSHESISSLTSEVLPREYMQLHALHIPVHVPDSIPALTVEQRRTELQALSDTFMKLGKKAMKRRDVLPLIVKHLRPSLYREYHEKVLTTVDKPRYLWRTLDGDYILQMPRKSSEGFQTLHGRKGGEHDYIWAIWKLETHGEAKIWRFLGSMLLPGHTIGNRILNEYMLRLPISNAKPTWYLNDAAYLDLGQEKA